MRVLLLLLAASILPAATAGPWMVLKTRHFELSYQAGTESDARTALTRLEQIRSFFTRQTGLDLDADHPIHVIVFRSRADYEPYQLSVSTDAYFAAMGSAKYIVLCGFGEQQFGALAHEYAHAALYAAHINYPPWLSEGLAEVYSTLQFTRDAIRLGGAIQGHLQALRTAPHMTVKELFATSDDRFRNDRGFAVRFYAHAWALTNLLMFSPEYATGFRTFTAALAAGTPERAAFHQVYGKDLGLLDLELSKFGTYPPIRLSLSSQPYEPLSVSSAELPAMDTRALLAGLLASTGQDARAAEEYRKLTQEQPGNSALAAAYGTVALRQHDLETARREWKRAMELGVADPVLCYQYAVIADERADKTTVPVEEIRAALQRALQLDPAFDDARWQLAFLENNAGNFQQSAQQLKAMKTIAPSREYAYWSTLSYVEDQLENHDAGFEDAKTAERLATSDDERAHARELAYMARTELRVRLSTGADGRQELITARAPRGTSDWNPFVQPSDAMRSIEGKLSDVLCTNGHLTGIVVRGSKDSLQLAIPDPQLVLVTNGPSQFFCGAQADARTVLADYAAIPAQANRNAIAGIVRGLRFE